MTMMTHFGDPCIHCGIPQADVAPGACTGDPKKARPIAYRSLGVRWDKVENFLVLMSDNQVVEKWAHISYHAPYYHFGYSDELIQPPRYHATLRLPTTGVTP